MAVKQLSADSSNGLPICLISIQAASSLNVPGIASNEKISFKLLSPIFSKYLRSVQKDSDWDNAVAANTLAAGSNVCI